MIELLTDIANYCFALFACVVLTVCDWVEAVQELVQREKEEQQGDG